MRAFACLPFAVGLVAACVEETSSPPPEAPRKAAAATSCTAADCDGCTRAHCRWCAATHACVTSGTGCSGLSIGMPDQCENDPELHARNERARFEACFGELLARYSENGPVRSGSLSSVPELAFPVERGKCYRVILDLEAGAKRDTLEPAFARMQTDKESTSVSGSDLSCSDPSGAHVVFHELCPQGRGELRVGFEDRFHQKKVLNSVGTGNFTAKVHVRRISDSVLRERAARDDADYCKACMHQRLECQRIGPSHGSTCAAEFAACLNEGGMSAAQCSP